jgi:hypothetical protein
MKNHKISNLKKNIHMDIALKPKRLNIGWLHYEVKKIIVFFFLDPKIVWISILYCTQPTFGRLGNCCLLGRHQSIRTPWVI